jgi:hypothetical protein
MEHLFKKRKLKKYICQYYGWIAHYGDWDCDDFIIMAYDKKEATEKMNDKMKTRLTKGEPSLMLLSTYKAKMKAFEPEYKKQVEEINNQVKK